MNNANSSVKFVTKLISMLRLLVILTVCTISCTVHKNIPTVDQTISNEFLKEHLTVIAGPEMEGRNTPSAGLDKAAKYIAARFKEWGLTNPTGTINYQQVYQLHRDSLTGTSLSVGSTMARHGIDYLVPLANNISGKVDASQIAFVGYGIEDKFYNDYEGKDVKGKVVMFLLGEPKVDGKYLATNSDAAATWTLRGLNKKLQLAAQKGAVAAIILNSAQASFNDRDIASNKLSDYFFPRGTGNTLPYFMVSQQFASKVFGAGADTAFKKSNLVKPFGAADYFNRQAPVSFAFAKVSKVTPVSNVAGLVEGSDKKDEYLVISAHYDHLGVRDGKIYYGADDDGSGTVGVMSLAKAFADAKKIGKGPRRSILFLLVSGEEKGLWGSEYYSNNPLYALDQTSVNLNIDMIGRIDTERNKPDTQKYVYLVGHNKLSSDLKGIAEAANNAGSQLTLDYKFDNPDDPYRIYFRSDHYNFARKGVPALFFYDGMLKADYHKPTDTVDKINWDLYRKRARLVHDIARIIADRNDMLKRDIPLPAMTR